MTGSTQRSGYLLPAIAGATAAAGILTYLYRNEAICSTGKTDQKIARVGGDVPFFGDLFTALARLDTVQDFYADTFEKTGNATFVFKIPFSPNNYVFNNPEILEFVLKTHFSVFDKGTRSYDLMYDLLGNGIFNVDGEAWRTQRKLAANIFNVKNFKDHVDSVFVDQEVAFSRAVELHIEASREFDVADLFYRLSFDTFAQIAFGVNMNSMLSHECIDIMKALDAVQKRIAHRFIDAFWRTTEYMTGESKVHKREIQLIRDFVQAIIQKNRVSGVSENDLLSLLMKIDDQLGKVPSDDELIYYVLNFLIAGRESTAASLGWSVLLLSKYPRVLDSLLKEINSTSNGERPTYEQIKNGMPYAKAVMRETMRLYPPVPLNIKQANTDITLPDGTFVPKGASVSWSVYAMGRTEEIWGPDAKEYRPERWLEMNKQPSPYNYPVFQAGPRVCLGQQMAELQVVYMLVQFVRNFKFEVVDPDSVTYTYSLTLRMKNGLKVRNAMKGKTQAIVAAATGLVSVLGLIVWAYSDAPIGSSSNSNQKLRRAPGAVPVLGDALTINAHLDKFHDFILEIFENNGNKTFSMRIPFEPMGVIVNDPKIVEYILKTKFHVFDKGPRFQNAFHDFLGRGIFNSDGEGWKSQRKLAANIFNVKNFKDFVSDVFVNEMDNFSQVLSAHAKAGDEFDLQDLFYRFTFDSFTKIAFGVDMNTVSEKDKAPFMVAFDEVQARTAKRFLIPMWETSEYMSGQATIHARQIREIREFGKDIIRKKRANDEAGIVSSQSDLLSLLMKVKDDRGQLPSDELLVDYALNFLLAGRDTTATVLTWAIYCLSQNPSCLEALHQELSALDGSSPTYEQMKSQLPYANAVFHETLRLYPSVPTNQKQANADDILPDGTIIPKGATVGWSTYAMGRTEAIWGPDAKQFRPERWLEMQKQPSPFDYPVFHAGPRVCLGKSMAELEGVFVLVQLLRQFDVQVLNGKDAKYSLSILLPMTGGLKARVSARA
ncbi:hypothetical protein HDU77_003270 [Chytriomyces hyalinus]|nr:hypothetical protein HDU77_003270 [Chytriomyces hyalinus]